MSDATGWILKMAITALVIFMTKLRARRGVPNMPGVSRDMLDFRYLSIFAEAYSILRISVCKVCNTSNISVTHCVMSYASI